MPNNRSSYFPSWQGQEGEGRCQITLSLTDTGQGIQGLLTGGEKPHIGGMVLALPRPSLSGEGWSADLYITPVPGHKDVEVASTVAESLARELRVPVAISAGIHSDHLCPEELSQLMGHLETLTANAIAVFKDKNE